MGDYHRNHEACLPVTALHPVYLGTRCVLLIGQGPWLYLQDLDKRNRRVSNRVFDVQAIHGIASSTTATEDHGENHLAIALVGGSHAAILSLRWTTEDVDIENLDFELEHTHQLDDWILKVHCHKFSSDKERFMCLTANNSLHVLLNPNDTSVISSSDAIQGPQSALYSGDVHSHRADHILVAAGSVFGEVLIWATTLIDDERTWIVRTSHRFQAHNGSVFGTRISQELMREAGRAQFVASCSDDRTIQVWNISDHAEQSVGSLKVGESSDTGFGHSLIKSTNRIATASGHMSRIWDVDFLTIAADKQKQILFIISRGEDATCQLWEFEILRISPGSQMTPRLAHVTSDRHHAGKNVLAWTHYKANDVVMLVSGGADGRVVLRPLQLPRRPSEFLLHQLFKNITIGTRSFTPKDYCVSDFGEVTTVTTTGDLLRCRNLQHEPKWELAIERKADCNSKICGRPEHGIVVSASEESLILVVESQPPLLVPCTPLPSISWIEVVAVNKLMGQGIEVTLIIIFKASSEPALLLRVNTSTTDKVSQVAQLLLPKGFMPTSACFITEHSIVFLGSRRGSLAFYSNIECGIHQSPTSTHHIHRDDAVTSLQALDTEPTECVHLLSTGRDGSYAIHAFKTTASAEGSAFQTLYQASPPFPVKIERALILRNPTSNQKELTLYGFRSKDFVVWNQGTQIQMLSVDCGGAHRSWDYSFNQGTGDHELVWTKACAFNYLRSKGTNVDILKGGGHGREIKALAFVDYHYEPDAPLIATGAEDTTIRLFQLSTQDKVARPKPLGVWSSHTTGVQHLAFSFGGQYLFSSGGNGEFFAWRVVSNIPLVGTGLKLLDKLVQNEDDADARLMSFDIMPSTSRVAIGTPGHSITLAIAYSNGKVKIMVYLPNPDGIQEAGTFVPQMELVYGTFCLMGVRAASNVDRQTIVVSAGSNGHLYPIMMGAEPMTASQKIKSSFVHQNSILALDCESLDRSTCLIATGGDDNALGLTLLTSTPEENYSKTFLVPQAHAAAITAANLSGYRSYANYQSYILITAGNDQRVKFWGIEVVRGKTPHRPSWKDIRIIKLHEMWTCVADLSNIAVLDCVEQPEGYLEYEIMVVGIGMEVLYAFLDKIPMLP